VFLCLTGDRDNRPNAGEERSFLGATTGPMPAARASASLFALSLGSELSNSLAPLRHTRIELLSRYVGTGHASKYLTSAESEVPFKYAALSR